MLYVIAYDISSDQRRNRVAAELENFGQRIQYSLFECDLDETRASLLSELLHQMTTDADQVRIYTLCQSCLQKSAVIRGRDFATDQEYYQI